jgi:hypothetical protein
MYLYFRIAVHDNLVWMTKKSWFSNLNHASVDYLDPDPALRTDWIRDRRNIIMSELN